MASKRKTWQEKYETTKESKVVVLPAPFAGAPAGAKMVISHPAEVESQLRRIPKGELVEAREFRKRLAEANGADITCPTSTSIFLRIVAEVALEHIHSGEKLESVAPFWRVVAPESPLASKLTCGADWIRRQRETEA